MTTKQEKNNTTTKQALHRDLEYQERNHERLERTSDDQLLRKNNSVIRS